VYASPDKYEKEFKFMTGTDSEVRKVANYAANYAILLKNKLYK
jgi:hypothetical protein